MLTRRRWRSGRLGRAVRHPRHRQDPALAHSGLDRQPARSLGGPVRHLPDAQHDGQSRRDPHRTLARCLRRHANRHAAVRRRVSRAVRGLALTSSLRRASRRLRHARQRACLRDVARVRSLPLGHPASRAAARRSPRSLQCHASRRHRPARPIPPLEPRLPLDQRVRVERPDSVRCHAGLCPLSADRLRLTRTLLQAGTQNLGWSLLQMGAPPLLCRHRLLTSRSCRSSDQLDRPLAWHAVRQQQVVPFAQLTRPSSWTGLAKSARLVRPSVLR